MLLYLFSSSFREYEMGLEELKAKFQEEKEERQKRKITEMMLGESRVMCRYTQYSNNKSLEGGMWNVECGRW